MTNKGSNRNDVRSDAGQTHSAAMRDSLKAYADGELSTLRRWLLSRHLAGCADCREEIRGLNRVSEEIRHLPQPMPRPELRARILASLPDAPPAPARSVVSFQRTGAPARLSLAGALCALMLVSLFAFARYRASQTVPNAQAATTQPGFAAKGVMVAATPAPVGDRAIGAVTDIQQSSIQPALRTADAPATTVTAMTDETSREADRILFEERKGELAQAIRQARKVNAQRLAAVEHHRQQIATGSDRDHMVQLAVADVAVAHTRLRNLVQTVGGTFASTNGAVVSSSVSGGASRNPSLPGDPTRSGNPPAVVTIAVPAEQASRFQTALNEIGTPTQFRFEPGSKGAPGVYPVSKLRFPTVAAVDGSVAPHVLESEPATVQGDHIPDSGMMNYKVFTIRLSPASPPSH
jgi:hypothetical protein